MATLFFVCEANSMKICPFIGGGDFNSDPPLPLSSWIPSKKGTNNSVDSIPFTAWVESAKKEYFPPLSSIFQLLISWQESIFSVRLTIFFGREVKAKSMGGASIKPLLIRTERLFGIWKNFKIRYAERFLETWENQNSKQSSTRGIFHAEHDA